MKCFLLLLLLCFYQNGNISCLNLMDLMANKWNQLTNTLTNALTNIRQKIQTFIFPGEDDMGNKEEKYVYNKLKTKIAFCDVIEEEAARGGTESPEYIKMRSEPTALMSTAQLATLHGKTIESHVVITEDGYLLTLHRLRRPEILKERDDNNIHTSTILLHHGLLGSSADWILLGPEESLPYILLNAGCDVWLTNARGNYYSRGHSYKKIDSLDFWKFSFQEMGEYDLPAVVNYIRNVKNSTEQINYIGHSMGATAFIVMLSSLPEYNDYFRIGILLAPLVYMTNTVGPLQVLTSMARRPPEQLLRLLGEAEFLPNRQIPFWVAKKYCKGPEIFCLNPLLFLSGSMPVEDSWNKSLIARVLYHLPAGGSTNTILHYSQLVKSGKFHKFNDENNEFNIKLVTVPVVLFSSKDDWLATIPDVLRLFFSIINPIDHFVIEDKKIGHNDFVWSPDANSVIFEKILAYLVNNLNFTSSKVNEV